MAAMTKERFESGLTYDQYKAGMSRNRDRVEAIRLVLLARIHEGARTALVRTGAILVADERTRV